MKEEITIRLIILAILLFLLFIGYCANSNAWNDGHCSCGGNWVYQEAVGHSYDTWYLYQCDKCGKTQEFHRKR